MEGHTPIRSIEPGLQSAGFCFKLKQVHMKSFIIVLLSVMGVLAMARTSRAEDPAPTLIGEKAAPAPASTPSHNPYPYTFFHPKEPFYIAPQASFSDLSPSWTMYPLSYPAYVWTPTSAWIPNRNLWSCDYFPFVSPPWFWCPGSIYVLGSMPHPCGPSPYRNTIRLGSVTISWR